MTTTVVSSVGTGKTYSTLADWWAAKKANIVAADQIQVAEIYGGASVGGINMDTGDATVDASHYYILRAATGHAHAGVFDTNKAYVQNNSGNTLRCLIANTRLQNLCIENTDANTGEQSLGAAGDDMLIDNCLIRNANGYALRVFPRTANHPSIFRNSVIYSSSLAQDCIDVGGNGFGNAASECAKFYNCSLIHLGILFDLLSARASTPGSSVITTQNCYLHSATAGRCYGGDTGSYSKGDHDATSDTEAVTASLRSIGFNTTNFTNISYATLDMHLKAAATSLIKKGVNLASIGVTTDFERQLRAGAYDIGADEIAALVNASFLISAF